jgi:hypothetical protein
MQAPLFATQPARQPVMGRLPGQAHTTATHTSVNTHTGGDKKKTKHMPAWSGHHRKSC